MKVIPLAFIAALISPGVQAATSIDIQVADALAPPACDVNLGNGGVIDYGTIHASKLNADANDYTLLEEKKIALTITCESKTLVAMTGSSNRRNTLAGGNEGSLNGSAFVPVLLFGAKEVSATGLGMAQGKKVGGFAIKMTQSQATADGVSVDQIYSYADSPNNWIKNAYAGVLLHPSRNRRTSWGLPSSNAPVAFSTLTAELGVQAYINKRSELDLSQPVQLDGSVTLELMYL